MPYLSLSEKRRQAEEASYQASLRRGQESLASGEPRDSTLSTVHSPSVPPKSPTAATTPKSPVATTTPFQPREITADLLKSIPSAKRKSTNNDRKDRVTKTNRRPSRKMNSRKDARSMSFDDLSHYDQSFTSGTVDHNTKKKFLAFERLAENYENKGEATTLKSLREALHEVEFFPDISHRLIKETGVLKAGGGLRRIIDATEGTYPPDIYEDALALWYRWKVGDINTNPMRYCHASGSYPKLDKAFNKYHWNYSSTPSGNANLQNGQCWPFQLALLRDGGHGSKQGGIHGTSEDGAYSIIVSGGGAPGYEDLDEGDKIQYTGTLSNDPLGETRNTKLMRASVGSPNPVRVFRSHRGNTKYSPERGIRYDGLYLVVAEVCLDRQKQHYRFELRRVEGQQPIRALTVVGPEMARPSKAELLAWEKIQIPSAPAAD